MYYRLKWLVILPAYDVANANTTKGNHFAAKWQLRLVVGQIIVT
jgi:hypothetical protein